ncbi:DUF58 domain-containing protein [Photobacterium atrarenae]|uniref:DUF58 domain-containing protein n=1 Tax=Photobacterium atrarenae TaxID=865757 RepID=A0ABY5GMF8_9GAMM|nr:DUF58 domain-containing protein [Photobacterium atrarenae]UTV30351.1 DUF58 domain-containing protein [Photobacterium atrarenae]
MTETSVTPALPPHSDGVNLCLAELLQYKNQAVRWLPPAQSIWSQLNGQHLSRKKGRGMNFSEVRPYQPGDDIRAIDWRVTARTGKTHTKLFTEEREQPVMLLIDLSQNMHFGSMLLLKSVQAAHFASLLSWLAVSEQDRIGAIIYTGFQLIECKPTARQQGPLRVINALIEAHRHQEPEQVPVDFAAALKHLHHLCPKGSDIVVISDFYLLTATDKHRLSQLRQHNRIRFVQVSDPLEQGYTHFRGTEHVRDNHQALWVDFSAKDTRQQLHDQYHHHQQFLHNLAHSLAIPVHHLSAAQPLMSQLNPSGVTA